MAKKYRFPLERPIWNSISRAVAGADGIYALASSAMKGASVYAPEAGHLTFQSVEGNSVAIIAGADPATNILWEWMIGPLVPTSLPPLGGTKIKAGTLLGSLATSKLGALLIRFRSLLPGPDGSPGTVDDQIVDSNPVEFLKSQYENGNIAFPASATMKEDSPSPQKPRASDIAPSSAPSFDGGGFGAQAKGSAELSTGEFLGGVAIVGLFLFLAMKL